MRPAFVGWVGIAVNEADADALDPEPCEVAGHRLDRRLVQGHQHPTVHVDPLGHRQPALARHQRGRLLEHDVVLVVAALVADVEHVAEALGGHERGERALALDDRVGRERGAVDEQPHCAGVRARAHEHVVHPGEHRLVRGARCGEDLGGGESIAMLEHDVGEGAADIHSNSEFALGARHDYPFSCVNSNFRADILSAIRSYRRRSASGIRPNHPDSHSALLDAGTVTPSRCLFVLRRAVGDAYPRDPRPASVHRLDG